MHRKSLRSGGPFLTETHFRLTSDYPWKKYVFKITWIMLFYLIWVYQHFATIQFEGHLSQSFPMVIFLQIQWTIAHSNRISLIRSTLLWRRYWFIHKGMVFVPLTPPLDSDPTWVILKHFPWVYGTTFNEFIIFTTYELVWNDKIGWHHLFNLFFIVGSFHDGFRSDTTMFSIVLDVLKLCRPPYGFCLLISAFVLLNGSFVQTWWSFLSQPYCICEN